MKQIFLNTLSDRLAAKPTSQLNEVLFFATAHFLFFNFMAAAQNTLPFFCNPQPNPKKNERVFSPTLFKYLFIILYSCASK